MKTLLIGATIAWQIATHEAAAAKHRLKSSYGRWKLPATISGMVMSIQFRGHHTYFLLLF